MKSRKFLAVLTALVMMMALSVPVFADTTVPSEADKGTVTIAGVEAGATVTLYQIVKPVYNTAGLEKFEPVTTGTIADLEHPTANEITALARSLAGSTGGITASAATDGSGNYVGSNLAAGMYLVLVKGTGATVYNPMIVSINYDKDNKIVSGDVSAANSFVEEYADPTLAPVTVYAKKSTPNVDKSITSTDSNDKANANGGDVAIGDTVDFKIETAIPSYSKQYTSLKFDVSDTLSAGFTGPSNVVVKVDGKDVTADDCTLTAGNGALTASFTDTFIRANGGKSVVITYFATLNESAALNYDPNTNKATIKFSNDPTDSSKYGTKDDETYTYTFSIDGLLGGTTVGKSYTTHELIKIKEDGKVEVVSATTEPLDEIEVTNPLAGAVFTLKNTATNKTYTATSDANGYIKGFTGLDAGTYTLVETTAPAGYVADTTTHSVVISADYNANGTLKSYAIAIDGEATSTYTATYENGTPTITEIKGTQETLAIKNVKIPNLPSTGGIGTTIFYVVGAALILGAGILLITKKRMSDKA